MAPNAKPIIFYDSFFNSFTPSASSTDAGAAFNVLNIKDYRVGTLWKAAASGTSYIEVNPGFGSLANTLFIKNHNLGTAGAMVSVESSATGAWAGEEVVQLAGFSPSSDIAIFKTFTQQGGPEHWRILITGASVAPYMGVALLGTRMEFERWIDGQFGPRPETIKGQVQQASAGQFINAVIAAQQLDYNVRFSNLTRAWVENTFNPARDAHLKFGRPFAWIWDFTNDPTNIQYVFIPPGSKIDPVYTPTRMSLSLKFRGVAE